MTSRCLPIRKSRLVFILAFILILSVVALVPGYASPTAGSIEGTITYYGPIAGEHTISVAVFLNPDGSGGPEETLDLPGRSIEYAFSNAPPGTYYITTHFDVDDSGGPPDPGEPSAWYDGNGDGEPDPVVVDGSAVTGIHIALGDIVYVNGDAAGSNDGSCWADAYTEVHAALGASTAGEEIWISEGAYRPTDGTSRTSTFQLKSGVGLYGGFNGTELLLNERDWQAYPTFLTGDIGTDNVATDNSYHVVTADGVGDTARIDGLVIADGYANVAGTHDRGGGLRVDNGASPTVANVTFMGNYAVNHGAGMSSEDAGSDPLVINCIFTGNSTSFNGAMANLYTAQPTVINTTFNGNTGGSSGGIVNLENGSSIMRNVIFWDNNGSFEIFLHNGGTIDIQYSIIDEPTVYTGTGNSNEDPLFVDADGPDDTPGTLDDDFRLQAGSPAIDAGSNSAVPDDLTDMDGNGYTNEVVPLDFAGDLRFVNGPEENTGSGSSPIVDIGAYESQSATFLPFLQG